MSRLLLNHLPQIEPLKNRICAVFRTRRLSTGLNERQMPGNDMLAFWWNQQPSCHRYPEGGLSPSGERGCSSIHEKTRKQRQQMKNTWKIRYPPVSEKLLGPTHILSGQSNCTHRRHKAQFGPNKEMHYSKMIGKWR